MMRHSVQSRDRIFVKNSGFLSFTESIAKYFGENISKNSSCKNSPGLLTRCKKFFDHAKQSAPDAFKIFTFKRANSKNSRSNW